MFQTSRPNTHLNCQKKGTHNIVKFVDIRLPITKSILIKLQSALLHTVQEAVIRVLLSTIFLLAFHTMQLGELFYYSWMKIPYSLY